jgi:hypothetical protein
MIRKSGVWHIGGWLASSVIVACASSNSAGSADFPGVSDFSGSGASSNSGENGAGGASLEIPRFGDGGVSLPPEQETSATFELPHAGLRFVYSANPDTNTVAVIDGTNLAIHSVQAGAQPRFLQTLAGADAAIVLNVASGDASIIRTADTGISTMAKVPVQPGSNAIAVAPDGKHAIVYYDATSTAAA